MPAVTDKYRLGRDCTFALDGVLLPSVREVSTKRTVEERDATGFNHQTKSTLVVRRTWEMDVAVLSPADAERLIAAEAYQKVVTVTTTNGLRPVSANFTVHECSADEPLDDAVVATFTLKQWSHAKP